jgi:hypothetical protein
VIAFNLPLKRTEQPRGKSLTKPFRAAAWFRVSTQGEPMKVPFRFQVSEYDCVPTTALNALSYLYKREEIPPLAIQRIFMYCLDSVSPRQNVGHGTSPYAVQLLGNWLNEFKHKNFETIATYITGEDVHLSKNNSIARTLNAKGAALLRIKSLRNTWHYILGLRVDDSWLYAFDPYPRTTRSNSPGKYEFLKQEDGQDPNIRIHRSWIDVLSNNDRYRFGTKNERESLLLQRKKV